MHFTVTGMRGVMKKVLFTEDTFSSLEPSTELRDPALDLLLYNAADIMRVRVGCDVRVLETAVMRAWLDWTELCEGDTVPNSDKLVDTQPPELLRRTDMTKAEHIIMPWSDRGHYSVIIVSNAGAVPSRSCELNRPTKSCHSTQHSTQIPDLLSVCRRPGFERALLRGRSCAVAHGLLTRVSQH